VFCEAMRTRLMLPDRGSAKPRLWKPRLPSQMGNGDGGTVLRARLGFFSDDLRGERAIGFDEMELPDMMELAVP